MNNEVGDPHLTTKIVTSYVRHHTVGADQVSELITSVHRALGQLGQPVQPEKVRTPAVSVRQSVPHEYVVCLDCGYRGKMLQRHVARQHALNRDEYLQRWGLWSDHPLTAPAYSERRSIMAKKLGLGLKPSVEVNEAAPPAIAVSVAAASVNADGKSEATQFVRSPLPFSCFPRVLCPSLAPSRRLLRPKPAVPSQEVEMVVYSEWEAVLRFNCLREPQPYLQGSKAWSSRSLPLLA